MNCHVICHVQYMLLWIDFFLYLRTFLIFGILHSLAAISFFTYNKLCYLIVICVIRLFVFVTIHVTYSTQSLNPIYLNSGSYSFVSLILWIKRCLMIFSHAGTNSALRLKKTSEIIMKTQMEWLSHFAIHQKISLQKLLPSLLGKATSQYHSINPRGYFSDELWSKYLSILKRMMIIFVFYRTKFQNLSIIA